MANNMIAKQTLIEEWPAKSTQINLKNVWYNDFIQSLS